MSERAIDFRIFKNLCLSETLYSAGAQIVGPGSPEGLMYIVKSGWASVQVHGVAVEEIREGGIFGEMGVVDPRPHTATVYAVADTSVFIVTQSQFLQIIGHSPAFALRVMKVLARRVRAMNARVKSQAPEIAELAPELAASQ